MGWGASLSEVVRACADVSTFCWVFAAFWEGVDLKEFPNIKKWMDKIAERAAVKEGLDVLEVRELTSKTGPVLTAAAHGC